MRVICSIILALCTGINIDALCFVPALYRKQVSKKFKATQVAFPRSCARRQNTLTPMQNGAYEWQDE